MPLSVLPQNQWPAIHRAGSQAEEQLRRFAEEEGGRHKSTKCTCQNLSQFHNIHLSKSTKSTFTNPQNVLAQIHKMYLRKPTKCTFPNL